jgi:hypothetical protein
MRACLECHKEYENKREASKFCSAKCRVKYNRKNPQQMVTPVQMRVLYDMALGVLEEIKNMKGAGLPLGFQNFTQIGVLNQSGQVEPLKLERPQTALKSFEQWRTEKHECESEEKWEKIKAGIEAAPNLTRKQKDLLIKYS